MEGIEILSVGETVVNPGYNIGLMFFVGLFITFVGIITGMICDEESIAFLGMVLGLFIGIWVGFITSEPEYAPVYKVTISDTVSLNDFNERYEILEQDGKIYTIKERMPDAN